MIPRVISASPRSRNAVMSTSGTYSRNTLQGTNNFKYPPSDATDINAFIDKHRRLVELLFPLNVTLNACLYVLRWENYFLTSAVVFVLCVLMYYPSLFLSFLTLLAIVLMAVGKYYGQTKNNSILKTRESPSVNYIQQDEQTLERLHKEQKKSHTVLVEYKQIIQNIEGYILVISKLLDYLYRMILWQSPEVSLCITVLLCICFVLLCTIHLRVIASCVPILILCSNRHFLKRTVHLWKEGGHLVYKLVKLKTRQPNEVHSTTPSEETGQEQTLEDSEHSIQEQLEVETNRGRSRSPTESSESAMAALSVGSTSDGDVGGSVRESSRPNVSAKVAETCTKCKTSFSKLLKRRHRCSNCGRTFCGSCTVKVKRAFLGATSPAAYEESVRVCVECKTELNRVSETTSVRA